DVYGTGDADRLLGRAIQGRPRERMCIVGAVGHDFYRGERDGPRGYPRFTDPRLRDASEYGDYLRMATERSLERCGIDSFDLLLPPPTTSTSSRAWSTTAGCSSTICCPARSCCRAITAAFALRAGSRPDASGSRRCARLPSVPG